MSMSKGVLALCIWVISSSAVHAVQVSVTVTNNAPVGGTYLTHMHSAMPALLMQFACMYVPLHILLHHILPGMALAIVGGIAGLFLLRPR